MSQSPAKRRKTSENTSIPITSPEQRAPPKSTPTTPTRPSYQSPTKASLARSHPHLTRTNSARSMTEPRGRSIRNEILSKPLAQSSQQSQDIETATNDEQPIASQNTVQVSADTELQSSSNRAPLQPRQPSTKDGRTKTTKQFDDFVAPVIPRLVKSGSQSSRATHRTGSDEPELPPTPVQLGIDPAPERPRGLSSSSPRSSSGRRRRRLLDDRPVTSSPLKPNRYRDVVPDVHDQESEAEIPEVDDSARNENQPEELKQQRKQLSDLRQALKEAQREMRKLEQVLNANDVDQQLLETPTFLHQLKTIADEMATSKDELDSAPPTLPYKELFAPGNLRLSTTTSSRVLRGSPKLVHHISIAAPPPWPSHVFCASFEVTTDVENKRVDNILWTDTLPGRAQAIGITNELHDWMAARLESTLHGHDVGGLIWGIGTYFEKAVERARVFKLLARKYQDIKAGSKISDLEKDAASSDGRKLTQAQAYELIEYLSKSCLTIELPNENEVDGVRTRRETKTSPRLMVVWKLDLTWTGSVKTTIELVPSGIPESAQQSVTDLFERLMKSDGVQKALDSVHDMVRGVRDEMPVSSAIVGKGPAKKRKRLV